MPELLPIRTAASVRSRCSRANTLDSQASRPKDQLHRIVSGHHIDDASVYHHDRDHHHQASDEEEEDTLAWEGNEQEQEKEDCASAREEGLDEVPEVRDGILDCRDLEAGNAPLEKKPTARSVKDPNLVSVPDFLVRPSRQGTNLVYQGIMGRPG